MRGREARFTFHGKYVPAPLPRRPLPTAPSVSRISPTSDALARANRWAISGAVPGSLTQ